MTALQTDALSTDELVKIARKQIDAFNNGDWEQARELAEVSARLQAAADALRASI